MDRGWTGNEVACEDDSLTRYVAPFIQSNSIINIVGSIRSVECDFLGSASKDSILPVRYHLRPSRTDHALRSPNRCSINASKRIVNGER